MKNAKTTPKSAAIKLAKDIAKLRDGYICQKCYRSKEQGWAIHGAHIMPVTYGGTAADPENILSLCAKCHSMGKTSAHQDPVGFGNWYESMYPGKYKKLRNKAIKYDKNPFPKIDWEELRQDLLKIKKKML